MSTKAIYWYLKGKRIEGFANMTSEKVVLCNDTGAIFDSLPKYKLHQGITLQAVYDKIPEIIDANFKLNDLNEQLRRSRHGTVKKKLVQKSAHWSRTMYR